MNPFTLDIVLTHKCFFLLNQLPKNKEVDIWIRTPAGIEPVDFIDIFFMDDGTPIAAWLHPFQKLPLHDVIAFCDGKEQIINLYPLERIIDIYDRPIDAEFGTFSFTKSIPIGEGDWRCDKGSYGPRPFDAEQVSTVITDIGQVVFFEPFLSLSGTAHLIYLESNAKSELANEKLNNSTAPIITRTLQEVMRLIYEWSTLADEPFNSTDQIPLAANKFLSALNITDSEFLELENLPFMQVSNYLIGSENARVRPSNTVELSTAVKNIVFRRMASSSLSALFYVHGIEYTYGLIELENAELDSGIQRFKNYYNLEDSQDMNDFEYILEHVDAGDRPFVHNQLRFFKNKKSVLKKVIEGKL